ncbi:hypothetical protein GCM10009850_027960 [Nonomuraea monospora]|uniref:Secreted protein n=1 Tax=Nonomuraea monospora TaxID=568818 RepID=A0ABN3CDA0_9ACTN
MKLRDCAAGGVCAAFLALVCGCSATAAGPVPDAATVRHEEPTPHDEERLHRAEELLLRDCMRGHGFETWPTPFRSPVPEYLEFPYAVTDVAWARRHGYGSDLRDRIAELRRTDPNRRYFESLPPDRRAAALVALNGARADGLQTRLPTGGVVRRSDSSCTSQAERRLYGDLDAWYRAEKITGSLPGLRVAKVTADARFGEAVRRWSGCMREHGHAYSTPAQARSDALRPEGGRAREIRVAVAEATCAAGTGLTATAHRLEGQYKRAVEEQYRAALGAKRDLQLAALPRAAAIIAGH